MDPFRPSHILAATDGSPASANAIRAAADLAAASGARLTVVTCTAPSDSTADPRNRRHPDAAQAADDEARARLREAFEIARVQGMVAALRHAFAEEPYQGILDIATRHGCDLIVLASRGLGRVSSVLRGSQTLAMLVHSSVPVLVCPEGAIPSWRHVLVPTDGSDHAQAAVPFGAALARIHGGRVTVLMCSLPLSAAGEPGGMDRGEYEDLVERTCAESLASATASARGLGVEASHAHMYAAAPWRAITAAATSLGAGVICMASHDRSGTAAVAIASETLKVLTHSRVPVLFCRAPRAGRGNQEAHAVQAA